MDLYNSGNRDTVGVAVVVDVKHNLNKLNELRLQKRRLARRVIMDLLTLQQVLVCCLAQKYVHRNIVKQNNTDRMRIMAIMA